MKYVLLSMLFGVVALQNINEDYPGQQQHARPPEGWMCEHQNYQLSVPLDHACNCERSCDPQTGQLVEDKQCKVWCHADHCACDVANQKECKH